MEILLPSFLNLFGTALSSIGPFLILLGVLIFIHELGHFLVARWCGVQVEVFSLGFGPKIFKYKKGETVYCISALPFGGYVKMFGDNPLKSVSEAEKHKGFLYKKVPQKLAIAFGGPFMNLLFTFLAFCFLGLYGLPAYSPTLGDVPEGTLAWEKGLRPGDTVTTIEGKTVNYLEEVVEKIRKNAEIPLKIELLSPSGKTKTLTLTPEKTLSENPFELTKHKGHIDGMDFASKGTRIGIPSKNSLGFKSGLRTFDEIIKINERKVRYWRELEPLLNSQKTPPSVTVKRTLDFNKSKKKEKTLHFQLASTSLPYSLKTLGLESPELYIYKVGKGTPAAKSGLKRGDKILAIEGEKLKIWEEFAVKIQTYKGNKSLEFSILREGQINNLSVQPKKMITENTLKEKIMVGVVSGMYMTLPEEKIKQFSFPQALIYAGKETGSWLKAITANIVHLVTGKISYRNIAGPVGIGRVAHRSFQEGLLSFVFMMALISLSLFYINLLPIPLLDGGHILFFSIEGILRRPLDLKKLILAQQIGLVTVLGFFTFTLFNDIYNWLTAW